MCTESYFIMLFKHKNDKNVIKYIDECPVNSITV